MVRPRTAKAAYRYGITVSRDFLTLEKTTSVRGSVYAMNVGAATVALEALLKGLASGSLVRSQRTEDHEYSTDSGAGLFVKLDFDEQYVDRLTGETGVREMRLSEEVQYSGARWAVQPTLRNEDGTGGYSIPQCLSTVEGSRTVRGSVTAADRATAEAWAKKQRALLTGDASGKLYRHPERWDAEAEFVPRVEGVWDGAGQNVRIWRVGFTFGEILPNYPASD